MSLRYTSFRDPFMDWSKQVEVGTCILMKWSKCMASLGMKKNPTYTNRLTILILYVDDILLIENDVPTLQDIKIWLSS